MLERIAICLCHPKKIGMFFKDKISYALGLLGMFFILLAGLAAIVSFNSKYLNYNDAKEVTFVMYRLENVSDDIVLDFDNNKLTGTGQAVSYDGITIYFLRKSKINNGSYMTYDFKEDNVDVYYKTYQLGTVAYKDIDCKNSIIISEIINNKATADDFTKVIEIVNSKVNTNLGWINYGMFMLNVVITYLIVFAASFMLTFVMNSAIDYKMRSKLLIYSTLIYFLLEIFYLLYSYSFIEYIAMIIPVMYSLVTLFHIRKVNKKKL